MDFNHNTFTAAPRWVLEWMTGKYCLVKLTHTNLAPQLTWGMGTGEYPSWPDSPGLSIGWAPPVVRRQTHHWETPYRIPHTAWSVREGQNQAPDTVCGLDVRSLEKVNEDSDSERSSLKRRGVSNLGRKIRNSRVSIKGSCVKGFVFLYWNINILDKLN